MWETWADLVHPDAQYILDTLEENRDWYKNMVAPSPPIEVVQPETNDNENIRFQVTLEENENIEEETD